MKNKTFAIGDVHSCYRELVALYKKLLEAGLKPEKDVVVFMGDYIDRGPDSKKVVSQLIKWHKKYPHWVFLYGNHEDIFKDWINGCKIYGESNWFVNGGKITFESYGGHFGKLENGKWEAPKTPNFPKSHLDFLFKETVYLYEDDNYIFVHGGLVPECALKDQEKYLDTLIWARDSFIRSDYDWGKKVIFGHTADYDGRYNPPTYKTFEPIVMWNKIGIDTAICPPSSKKLTAIELPTEKMYFQEALYDSSF